jgi:hypothetical protein
MTAAKVIRFQREPDFRIIHDHFCAKTDFNPHPGRKKAAGVSSSRLSEMERAKRLEQSYTALHPTSDQCLSNALTIRAHRSVHIQF